jgi:hypothetical protein
LVGPAAVLLGGIAIAIALIAYGTIAKGIEQKNKEDLQAKKEKMQEYVKIKENYDSSKGVYDNVMTLYGQTQNMNEYLVDFIEELEEKMPESFVAMSLSASSSAVSMSVTCNTYTDAAEVIQQLRKFETLDPMSINASSFTKKVEEEKDENGNPVEKDNDKENDEEDENSTVSFSLSANYNMAYRAQQAAKEKK